MSFANPFPLSSIGSHNNHNNSSLPHMQIQDYRLGEVIGIGTYGEVRLGYNAQTGESVAIKIIDLERYSDDTRELLSKEINILQQIDHPNCIAIYEIKENIPFTGVFCDSCACTCFTKPDSVIKNPLDYSLSLCSACGHERSEHGISETRLVLLIIQELAVGGELFGIISNTGALTEDICRYYLRQLIAGIEFLHNNSICHRDLKLENLTIASDYSLKIIDFGLAHTANKHSSSNHNNSRMKRLSSDELHLFEGEESSNLAGGASNSSLNNVPGNSEDYTCHTGLGSMPYSGPECYFRDLYNNLPYDGRYVDIWSVGVILYIMINARPPFLRSLLRNFGAFKRDKHFIALQRGDNYGNCSAEAKDLISKLLKINPQERLTLEQVKLHPFYTGDCPSYEEIGQIMAEKINKTWLKQEKFELISIIKDIKSEEQQRQYAVRNISQAINIPHNNLASNGNNNNTGAENINNSPSVSSVPLSLEHPLSLPADMQFTPSLSYTANDTLDYLTHHEKARALERNSINNNPIANIINSNSVIGTTPIRLGFNTSSNSPHSVNSHVSNLSASLRAVQITPTSSVNANRLSHINPPNLSHRNSGSEHDL
jgi:serine/threonine protein kinase